MMDIVTSFLPFWENTRLWILSRPPLPGFAETFSQYIMEVAPGGGSDRPELDDGAEGVLFVVEGELRRDARWEHASDAPGQLCLHPACKPMVGAQHKQPAGTVSLGPQGL